MEDVIHDAVALRARQELGTETDEAACRDRELEAHVASRLRHVRELSLARAEAFHDSAHVLLRHFDRQVLDWLAELAVDCLVDNFRFADLQLVALAAHLLDEDGQMQLAAARYLEDIRRIRLFDLHRDVRLDFLEQAVAQMAARDELAFAAGERARVDAERHGERRLVDADGWQCFRLLSVSDRVADADIAEARQGDDLTHLGFRHFDALHALIDEDLADLRADFLIAINEHDILVRASRAAADAADSDAADEGICLERRDHHLQRAVRVAVRSRDLFDDRLHQRLEVRALIFHVVLRDAVAGRRVDDREVELIVIGIEFHEELEDFVVDIVHALVRLIDLIDDDDRLELLLQSLAQDVLRLRHRAFEGIDEQENAVDHVEDTLDLAAEVRMARGVDDVDLDAVVHDGRVLREDRDAALALDIARIHDALSHLLVRAEYMALLQHGIHKRRLAVVDVRNDCDIAELIISRHTHSV